LLASHPAPAHCGVHRRTRVGNPLWSRHVAQGSFRRTGETIGTGHPAVPFSTASGGRPERSAWRRELPAEDPGDPSRPVVLARDFEVQTTATRTCEASGVPRRFAGRGGSRRRGPASLLGGTGVRGRGLGRAGVRLRTRPDDRRRSTRASGRAETVLELGATPAWRPEPWEAGPPIGWRYAGDLKSSEMGSNHRIREALPSG